MVEFMNILKCVIDTAYQIMNIPIQFAPDFTIDLWGVLMFIAIASLLLWGVFRLYNND